MKTPSAAGDRVLVIVASHHDSDARSLAARWAYHGAALLTVEDLSVAGWRHGLEGSQGDRAVVSGRVVASAQIAGVLTRWPAIFPQELHHIAPQEREYVAAEMTAFLRAWLTQLSCPVINRPSAGSLIGPAWRPEQWVHAAARLGIPVRPVRRHVVRHNDAASSLPVKASHTTVTVVGEGSFGDAHPLLMGHALRLAAATGVALLDVHFSGSSDNAELLWADPLADVSRADKADAVLDHLLDGDQVTAPLRVVA